MAQANANTEAALEHLRVLKPYDGWSVDISFSDAAGKAVTMLCRRNAPLANEGFGELYHDRDGSGCVVGVSLEDPSKGQVLVEADGSLAREAREITFTRPSVFRTAAEGVNSVLERQRRERERRRANTQRQFENNIPCLSDEQNKNLLRAVGAALAIVVFLQFLASALFKLSILLIPVCVYASQTVPSNESFDAKKELKRVLRGYHLAEDDPRKPKGWLEQTVAKVQATVTTELSTSLGYEIELYNLTVATLAHTRVPAAKVDCYWVGVFGKWHYITMRNIPDRPKED